MIFKDTWFLLLLALIPFMVWFYFRRNRGGTIRFSSINTLKAIRPSFRVKVRHILIVLQCLGFALMVLALARPQKGNEETKISTEGIDIVLAIDRSGSMSAQDFFAGKDRINRLAAVKKVVQEFIRKRENDRIGMTVFSRYAYTQCPLTLDYAVLLKFLEKTEIVKDPQEDGTAIGDAIGISTSGLKDRPAKSKIIILLSDGDNNAGLDPLTAANLASTFKIKIYTIGAGHTGLAPFPGKDWFGNDVLMQQNVVLDEVTLKKIAEITGGKYFNAQDMESLAQVYAEIDKLEKTEAKATKYTDYTELFPFFLFPGLALILIAIGLENTFFRKLP